MYFVNSTSIPEKLSTPMQCYCITLKHSQLTSLYCLFVADVLLFFQLLLILYMRMLKPSKFNRNSFSHHSQITDPIHSLIVSNSNHLLRFIKFVQFINHQLHHLFLLVLFIQILSTFISFYQLLSNFINFYQLFSICAFNFLIAKKVHKTTYET